MIRFLTLLSLSVILFIQTLSAQTYYKVIDVLDNNMLPIPSGHISRTTHIGRYLTAIILNNGISIQYHNGSNLFMFYAGQDNATGNHFYAPQVLGQPAFTDMFGNYTFVQFEKGTNNMLIAMGGIMDSCIPITEEEYLTNTKTILLPPPPSNNNILPAPQNSFEYGNNEDGDLNTNKKVKENSYYEVCSSCHGTGYQQGYTSTPYYGGVRVKEYCPICKRRVYPHTHNPCSRCHGTGQVKRTNYSYE